MSSIIRQEDLDLVITSTGIIETIEKCLEQGALESEAAIAAGINPRGGLFRRMKRSPEVVERFAAAKARSKINLVRAVHIAATEKVVVKEIRNQSEVFELGDGSRVLRQTGQLEIIKELPPNPDIALKVLKATYPEEFGDVRRVDMKKIGNAQQVDLDRDVKKVDNAKQVIDMFLAGDGSFVPELDIIEEDDDEEARQELDKIDIVKSFDDTDF